MRSTGYALAADCLANVDGPTANPWPSAILHHRSGKRFVAYANNMGPIHPIYSW